MKTINISLTEEQAKLVDSSAKIYGFANRSEFVRALLRLVKTDENILKKAVITPFVAPHKIPTIPEIKKKIVPILEKNDVEFAGIFGSYARGEAVPESDLDLLIRFGRPDVKSLLDVIRIQNTLQDKLGLAVDLVEEGDLDELVKPSAEKDLKILYGKRRSI